MQKINHKLKNSLPSMFKLTAVQRHESSKLAIASLLQLSSDAKQAIKYAVNFCQYLSILFPTQFLHKSCVSQSLCTCCPQAHAS